MQLCQRDNSTAENRHPRIFKQVLELKPGPGVVLSFGCSSGEEVATLRTLNPLWTVHGADVSTTSLAEARLKDPDGIYVQDARLLTSASYDVIFCMSVLCRYPAYTGNFSFQTFESSLLLLLQLLKPNGILVLYNAQYDVKETHLKLLPLACQKIRYGSGFVPKFRANGDPIPEDEAMALPYLYMANC
jgi:SAM-dependent methyltransferase